jgi:hypothetical protein
MNTMGVEIADVRWRAIRLEVSLVEGMYGGESV